MTQDRDKQIKDLGINVHMIYEIWATLDNLEALHFFLSNEIERINKSLNNTKDNWLRTQIKQLMQLTFVISNEHKNCVNELKTFQLQLEGE